MSHTVSRTSDPRLPTGALPGTPRSWHSGVQVVTPHNIPVEAGVGEGTR